MSASESATVTASTKRSPAVSGGKVGAPVTNLASVLVVPLLPLNSALVEEAQLKNPREHKLTYAFANSSNTLPDIAEGDILVISSVEYLINYVKEYERPTEGSYLEIIVQKRVVA